MGIAVALIGIPIYVVLFTLAFFLVIRKPKVVSSPSDGRWMVTGFVVTLGLVPLGVYLIGRTSPPYEALVFGLLYLYLAPFVIYLITRVRHPISYLGKGAMFAFMSYPVCIALVVGVRSMQAPHFDSSQSWRICYVLEGEQTANTAKIPHIDTRTQNIAWQRTVRAHSLGKGFWCSNMGESLSPMELRVYTATQENFSNRVATVADKPTSPLHVVGGPGGTICVHMTPVKSKYVNDPEWKLELRRCDRR